MYSLVHTKWVLLFAPGNVLNVGRVRAGACGQSQTHQTVSSSLPLCSNRFYRFMRLCRHEFKGGDISIVLCRLCDAMGGAEKMAIPYGNHSLSNRVEEAVKAMINFIKKGGPKGWDDPWG